MLSSTLRVHLLRAEIHTQASRTAEWRDDEWAKREFMRSPPWSKSLHVCSTMVFQSTITCPVELSTLIDQTTPTMGPGNRVYPLPLKQTSGQIHIIPHPMQRGEPFAMLSMDIQCSRATYDTCNRSVWAKLRPRQYHACVWKENEC